MQPRRDCLTPAELEEIAEGETRTASDRSIGGHLDACSSCAEHLSEIRANRVFAARFREERRPRLAFVQGESLPRRIGDYAVVRELGRGGMGVVLLAEQAHPSRLVALKVMHPLALTQRSLRRFDFEIEALGRLRHPCIAQIFESGTFDDRGARMPYFAMEYVEGVDLEVHVAASDLDLRARLGLFLQIVAAVDHAHRTGVMHRDLKPGNVLVEASSGRPKVIDFGLARGLAAEGSLTRTGHVLGTLAYLAPEQTGATPAADTRTDVWGLGALLYFLLTGAPPHDVEELSLPAAIDVIRRAAIVPPSRRRAGLDPQLDWIVAGALALEPSERYASADALGADVRRFLDGRPVQVAARGVGYRARLFLRRHRVAVGVAVAFAAVVLGGAFGTLRGLVREAHAADRAERSAQDAGEVLRFVVDVFQAADPEQGGSRDWDAHEVVLSGGREILSALRDRPAVRAQVLESLGDILRHLGSADEAAELLEEAVAIRLRNDGPASRAYHEARARLAYTRSAQGRGVEARAMLEESREALLGILGPDAAELAPVTGNLAIACAEAMEHERAEALFDDVARLLSGPGLEAERAHWSIARASAQQQAGELERALRTLQTALDLTRDGAANASTEVEVSAQLAGLLVESGRYEEAGPIATRAIDLSAEILGPRHVRTLSAIRTRARLAIYTEEYERAEADLLRLLEHVDFDAASVPVAAWGARLELAEVRRLRGDAAGAREILEPTLERLRESEADDGLTLTASYYLSRALLDAGEYDGSIELGEQALEGWRESPDADYSIVGQLAQSLSAAYSHQGRFQEMVDVLEPLLEQGDRNAAWDPFTGLLFRLGLGTAKQQLGDPAGGIAALEPVLAYVDDVDTSEPKLYEFYHIYAWCLMAEGRGAEAVEPLRRVVAGRRELLGADHFETLHAQNGLAHLLGLHGDPAEAELLFTDLCGRAGPALGDDSDDAAWFRYRFAELLERLGRRGEAAAVAADALERVSRAAPTAADLVQLHARLAEEAR